MHYFNQSNKGMVAALPLLNRIQNNTLALVGYKMSRGLCMSLKEALRCNKSLLRNITLDNNGMQDGDMAEILEGLTFQSQCSSLVIKRNEVGEKSLIEIQKLLWKKKPNHLDELRLIGCKCSPITTTNLLEMMMDGTGFIGRLSLVDASLNDQSFRYLIQYILNNRNLKELDLSYNSITQMNMLRLAQVRLLKPFLLIENFKPSI